MKQVLLVAGGLVIAGCGNGGSTTSGTGEVSTHFDGGTTSELMAAEKAVVAHWQDENPCEALPSGPGMTSYVNLGFAFDGSRWTNVLKSYGDDKCTVPLFEVTIEGPYVLGPESTAVKGAVDAMFVIGSASITPQTSAMAMSFDQQMCGGKTDWAVGTAADVSQTGCLFVQSVTKCAAEYDLVQVDATSLQFGQRPMMGDICDPSRRPTALSPSKFLHAP